MQRGYIVRLHDWLTYKSELSICSAKSDRIISCIRFRLNAIDARCCCSMMPKNISDAATSFLRLLYTHHRRCMLSTCSLCEFQNIWWRLQQLCKTEITSSITKFTTIFIASRCQWSEWDFAMGVFCANAVLCDFRRIATLCKVFCLQIIYIRQCLGYDFLHRAASSHEFASSLKKLWIPF